MRTGHGQKRQSKPQKSKPAPLPRAARRHAADANAKTATTASRGNAPRDANAPRPTALARRPTALARKRPKPAPRLQQTARRRQTASRLAQRRRLPQPSDRNKPHTYLPLMSKQCHAKAALLFSCLAPYRPRFIYMKRKRHSCRTGVSRPTGMSFMYMEQRRLPPPRHVNFL